MTMNEVIMMLNSIDNVSNGTNLMYCFENKVSMDKPIHIFHIFTDKRMANFYYSVLNTLPSTVCTLEEVQHVVTDSVPYVSENEICYQHNNRLVWNYRLRFNSTLDLITGKKYFINS